MSSTPKPHAAVDGSDERLTRCPVHPLSGGTLYIERRAPRVAALLYGVVSYVAFVAVFVYVLGFVVDVAVPRSIDRAIDAPLVQAVVVDLGLLTLFALQHSVMARPAFKRWWTNYIPAPIERSTYVLLSSAVLALMCWQWRSIDIPVWHVESVPAGAALAALGGFGWGIALTSTFMIDHFELFGIRQVLQTWRSNAYAEKGFRVVLLYRLVRHPLMLGFLIAFWATPTMTAGHLLFAVATTTYILIALRFEERDLVDALGEQYRRYRQRVPMLVPLRWR